MANVRPMRMTEDEKQRILELAESGLSPRQISEEVDRHYITVLNFLKKNGLGGRTPRGRPKQPRTAPKLDPLSAIQELVDGMDDLRADNEKLREAMRKIAQVASRHIP